LISLINVAYYIVLKEIPATKYARELVDKNPGTNYFEPKEFKKLRLTNSHRFEKDLCSKANPFYQLAFYLYNKRDYLKLQEKKLVKEKSNPKTLENCKIDYDHLVSLIPDEYSLKGDLKFNKPTRKNKSQMFHDDSKDFEKSQLIKGSNFSDLSLDK